jgi:hypothetical protein
MVANDVIFSLLVLLQAFNYSADSEEKCLVTTEEKRILKATRNLIKNIRYESHFPGKGCIVLRLHVDKDGSVNKFEYINGDMQERYWSKVVDSISFKKRNHNWVGIIRVFS